ncbi:hypothetical protein Daura_40825 [Dactylosporangium aurantiacum]|uniref:Secreted protein n=1 Tax=Dactylosporangium aurantiacum TaxID=35754 RepID=A0A9Q9IBU0_9ACTN|nr:hypothetical protein [Dactylosporangium aurantiacum]MDG6102872.1 hypothetical protein [Dactylosporangium aurantiacum]UWZ52891.1 hypothetical protein Daura_40825 [Dactylosporangium aurantiacum]
MRRMLWLGIGLAVGALVVRAVTKKAQAFTPQGMAASARNSAVGFAESVRGFVDDVRDGMAEREAEIHAAFTDGSTLDEDLYPEGRQHR